MPMGKLSPAGLQLFGNVPNVPDFGAGSVLRQQVQDETEEQRRRREMGLGPLAPAGGSPALRALLGSGGMGMTGFGGGLR
jgi:hypothetical protein